MNEPYLQLKPQIKEPPLPIVQQDPAQNPPIPSKRNKVLLLAFCTYSVLVLFTFASAIYIRSKSKNINIPASTPTQIATLSPTISNFKPAKGIAFLRNGDVWKANINGSNEQQITNVGNITTFKWLPLSNKLIYDSRTGQNSGSLYALVSYDLSSQQKQIIFSKFWPDSGGISADYSIGYKTSSDEKYLFLTGDCCDQGGMLINISTLKQEQPFSKPIADILFSPNSDSMIVYVSEASNSGKWQLSSSKDFLPQKI